MSRLLFLQCFKSKDLSLCISGRTWCLRRNNYYWSSTQRNIVDIMVTEPEFLVAKDAMLATLVTLSVTILSPLTMELTRFWRTWAAQRAAKLSTIQYNYRNKITCMHRNRKPYNSFFMVNMACVRDRGRVRPTTTSRNMAAILQLIPSLGLQRMSLIFDIHVMVNWHLSKQGIGWPVARHYIAGSGL